MFTLLACFSCSYDARLLCRAARAASEPAVSSVVLLLEVAALPWWERRAVKVRSVVEEEEEDGPAVEMNSSVRKSSAEMLRSMVLPPMRIF